MPSPPFHALIIGSSGGIGRALLARLTTRGHAVTGLSRSAANPDNRIDITDEASIAAAAKRLAEIAPFNVVLVATGLLHGDDIAPEKSLRDLESVQLAQSFSVNAIGPALVARHFVPLIPRAERAVFAALSARVGSITDNRLGGWYGYRASKAALNMLIKTMAIELARTRRETICVALHPGTVDTSLSAPFQRNVAAGQLFTPDDTATHLIDVIDRLTPADSGNCFDWKGKQIAP